MAEKPRKTPVRTAPARKDYPSEVAWLQAKLEHAEAQQTKADQAKIARLDKRITAVQASIAELTAKLNGLTTERTKLVEEYNYSPVPLDEV